MEAALIKRMKAQQMPQIVTEQRSLSDYFPSNTCYFYGYPAGEGDFVNLVPPDVEELVAARALSCAGSQLAIVNFAATSRQQLSDRVIRALDIPQLAANRTVILPETIDCHLTGAERNQCVCQALLGTVEPGTLVMAQPFTNPDLEPLYQISPSLSFWLNDKQNMTAYLDASIVPQRLGEYRSGETFARAVADLTLPYVVKVTASSAGDGVYLCHNQADIQTAIQNIAGLHGSILVEQYIDAVKNYGVHFGIPQDKTKPIDILGVNEQLTSDDGEFLGGIIMSQDLPRELWDAARYLKYEVLPAIRDKGWYGIGCFDVLIDDAGKPYFIDCNFRMTGMSAYHFMVKGHDHMTPLISFALEFHGTENELIRAVHTALQTSSSRLQLISLSNHQNVWKANGALVFNGPDMPYDDITALQQQGFTSGAFDKLQRLNHNFNK